MNTVHYKLATMSFREYDQKMLVCRPGSKWWRLVLEKDNIWDKQVPSRTSVLTTDKYTPEEQEEQRKTNRIAISAYIQGNTGD
jgi:hypothetical protein